MIGHQIGVLVNDTDGAVTLSSDVVAKSTVDGLNATDQLAAGGGDVTATNVTLYDSAVDAHVHSAHLELDSSIVESPITASFSATCNITYSRGPTTSGNACQSFQTLADPMFVNPGADDYHLQAGSPMIDAGNTPPPPNGTLDVDGDPRVLDGNNSCPDRRDIGADEFLLAVPNPCPPETAIIGGPTGTTADPTPTFEFAANEANSSFQCRTDGTAFAACGGPGTTHTTATLADGPHTFEVRATDATALTDPTPALATFTVDTSSPPPSASACRSAGRPRSPAGPEPRPRSRPEPRARRTSPRRTRRSASGRRTRSRARPPRSSSARTRPARASSASSTEPPSADARRRSATAASTRESTCSGSGRSTPRATSTRARRGTPSGFSSSQSARAACAGLRSVIQWGPMEAPENESPELADARRLGYPYLVYPDAQGRQHVLSLSDDWKRITIGRAAGADVILAWDENVSKVHAEVERLADAWLVVDDGLSRNGTFVNGERVERRRRLADGDELRVGDTTIRFYAPLEAPDETRVVKMPPEPDA